MNKSITDRIQSNNKPKPAPSFQQSAGFGRYGTPETQRGNQDKYKSTSDGKMYKNYNDALAANRSRNKKTDTPTSTPTTPVPANRTPGVTPAPAAKPAATAPAKPAGTTPTAKPAPAPSASPARPSLSSQADEIRKMRAGSLQRQGRTLDAATVSGATRPAYQANSFDVFDVIKGHLIDEGYADTEEAALVIMANMSEEWREGILDEANRAETELKLTSRQRERARNLNQYTSRPIFYGTNANRREKADNSDPILNKAHKEMTAKRQKSHKEKRG